MRKLSKILLPYLENSMEERKFYHYDEDDLQRLDQSEINDLITKELLRIKMLEKTEKKHEFQKLFKFILSIQPTYFTHSSNSNYSQRIYSDIISTPYFLTDPEVQKFLNSDFRRNRFNRYKYECLTDIMDFYNRSSQDSIDKFNFMFRSSTALALELQQRNSLFSSFLKDDILGLFNKETLLQISRFMGNNKIMREVFFEYRAKALFTISMMSDVVYKELGHTSELFDGLMETLDRCESIRDVFVSYYDKYVKDEKNFEFTKESRYVLNELVNFVIENKYNNFLYLHKFKDVRDIDSFMRKLRKQKEEAHSNILGDEENSFRKINNSSELELFKAGLYRNIFGFSITEAEYLVFNYGKHIDELEKSVREEDKRTFEILRSIILINNLKVEYQDNIKFLQETYSKHFGEYGYDKFDDISCFVTFEGLLNKTFLNTYRDAINEVKDFKFIKRDSGVDILDAGVNFNMIINALNATVENEFYSKNANMASRWNTADGVNGQGMCCSFINNQSLGTISLRSPLLGFTKFRDDSLTAMGCTDIFTTTSKFNLRYENRRYGNSTVFIPASKMADETRYGYNELLMERFLGKSNGNVTKLQPSFVVFYKMDDNYEMSSLYKNSLKVAKDFGIPIVMIDFHKVQANEKKCINEAIDELFSRDTVNSDLVEQIVTRYMNNISGIRTIEGPRRFGGMHYYINDAFPKGDLGLFLDKYFEKCNNVDDDKSREWIEAIDAVYKKEVDKYFAAISVTSYNCSLSSNDLFILNDKYDLHNRIEQEKTKLGIEVDKKDEVMFRKDDRFFGESMSLINFSNLMGFTNTYDMKECFLSNGKIGYTVKRNETDEDISVEERLVVAYLTGNFKDDLLAKVRENPRCNINFNPYYKGDDDYKDGIRKSYFKDQLGSIDKDKLIGYLDRIESMDEKQFASCFRRYFLDKDYEGKHTYEELVFALKNRKESIRDDLSKAFNLDIEKPKKSVYYF